jgi:hypothetical protein
MPAGAAVGFERREMQMAAQIRMPRATSLHI